MFNLLLKKESLLSHISFLITGIILANIWIEPSLKESLSLKENYVLIGIDDKILLEKTSEQKNTYLSLVSQENGTIQCYVSTPSITLKRTSPFPVIETTLNFPFEKISKKENRKQYKLVPKTLTENISECQSGFLIQYGSAG